MIKEFKFMAASLLLTAVCLTGKPIMLSMAVQQEGSPVKIVGTKSTQESMYDEVKVKNISTQSIQVITFGVMFYPLPSGSEKPLLSRPVSVNVDLSPGQERTFQLHALSRNEARNIGPFASPQILGEIGVLSVEYSGGGVWGFDPMSRGGFSPSAASNAASMGSPARVRS